MRIYRSHPDENFTIIPNATLRDHRLTPTARGVLVELLSHSDGWAANADAMWRQMQRARGSDRKRGTGRRAYREAFTELEACGYMIRTTVRNEDGCFITELSLYDTPQQVRSADDIAHRGTANGTSVNGTSVNGTSVSGTSSRSTNRRTTTEEDGREEHSTSLAKARAAAASASARNRASELEELYEAVNRLNERDLHNALLKLEQKRPRIYRQCRRAMADQFNGDDKRILKVASGSMSADRMSYKYAIKHYFETADDWPAWLVRPLGWSPSLRRAA